MDRNIDAPIVKRFFDLLGEEAFSADFGKRSVLDPVTSRLDHHDLDGARFGQLGMRGRQATLGFLRLSQGQGTATGSQAQEGHAHFSSKKGKEHYIVAVMCASYRRRAEG